MTSVSLSSGQICMFDRENTKNGEIIGMKKVLLRFPFLASFKLSLLQKKSQAATVPSDCFSFVSPKCWRRL